MPPTRWVSPASPRREAFEDVLQLLLGYARSVVDHVDLHFGTDAPRLHPDIRSLRAILIRIRKQIHQYLANPVPIGFDLGQVGLDLQAQLLPAGVELSPHRPHRVFDQARRVGRLRL